MDPSSESNKLNNKSHNTVLEVMIVNIRIKNNPDSFSFEIIIVSIPRDSV